MAFPMYIINVSKNCVHLRYRRLPLLVNKQNKLQRTSLVILFTILHAFALLHTPSGRNETGFPSGVLGVIVAGNEPLYVESF
jgi:hypothetical protein